ncbi:MAG: ASCH domain-containing protein [Phycisphaerae bacterium]|nr:ASCH domain-containing protein [Phycisphaerae bacterium]
MLLMRRVYFEAIRQGKKTTTLRFWPRPLVRSDTIHNIPGLGTVRIDQIRCICLSTLTDADARADGFESLAQLRQILQETYPPEKRRGRKLYQIHFTYLPAAATQGATSAGPS